MKVPDGQWSLWKPKYQSKLISAGVTVKDIVLLFGACIVVTAVFYTILVSLVSFAMEVSFKVPVERLRERPVMVFGGGSDLEVIYSTNEPIVPVEYKLQATEPVQKTKSASAMLELSNGVEMLPIEMLRSGQLVN